MSGGWTRAEWRPISEAPREDHERLLVATRGGEVVIAYWLADRWHYDDSTGWIAGVTHFQPLPPPPRDDGETKRMSEPYPDPAFGLGDRMKRYEAVTDASLTRRVPAIVRVDGKAFHSLTRGMERPFDPAFTECMAATAAGMVTEIQGAKLAYCQSDEISVLLTDFDTIHTDAWFGYRVQKMASVSAAIATAYFTKAFRLAFPGRTSRPLFDARVFSMPADEVANYFVWRQKDAVRNSILATGQAHFSAKELHGVSCDQLQEKLFAERNVNWNDTPTHHKRGLCVTREEYGAQIDMEPPTFTADRAYIEGRLPVEEPK